MKMFKLAILASSVLLSWAACAETVKITNIGHGYYSGALYIAKREKLFEKYGLEPEISFVQGGPLALQAALTKQADVAVVSYEHILTSAVQGKQIVAFFNIANRPVNNVIANDKLFAGSEKLSVEDKIKRLKGMRVAMPSAGGWLASVVPIAIAMPIMPSRLPRRLDAGLDSPRSDRMNRTPATR